MNQFQLFANLKRTAAPVIEPIDLATAEAYLRVPSDSGGPIDQDIQAFISFAREYCETVLRRSFLKQTWQLNLRNWPGRDYQNWPTNTPSDFESYQKYNYISLPMAAPLYGPDASPPAAPQVSITYLDTSASILTFPQGNIPGGYNVDPNFEPARVFLPFSQIWPTTILLPGAAITLVYQTGYPDVATWMAAFEGANGVLHAMKKIIAYVYENKIPPDEMRRSSIAAGMSFVVEEMLSHWRIYES